LTPTITPTFTVTPFIPISAAYVVNTYPPCYDSTNGSVTLSGTGGNGDYQYSLNGSTYQSSATFTGLSSTTYTGYVKDSQGIIGTISINISISAPSATTTVLSNVSCYGGANGSIRVSSPTGGQAGQRYHGINNPNPAAITNTTFPYDYTGLGAGTYTIYIKDSSNCVAGYPVTITQPTQQTASITIVSQPTCPNNNDGVITVSSTGGVWPKTYVLYADTSSPYTTCGGTTVGTWTSINSGAPATFNVTGLTSHGYCLEVTDANGCVTNSGITGLDTPPSYYKYQVIRCSDNAYLYMTSPDSLPSPFMTGVAAVKINNVCYQVDYFVETTCTQSSLHLTDGGYSTVWTSCSSCTSGGAGAQV
jgi:hypothetical protein